MGTKVKKRLYSKRDYTRLSGASGKKPHDGERTAFQKDYARLIHAPSFRRLQHKTQLFPGLESDFFRNRLTHSLEVAQIATGIVTNLNPLFREQGLEPIDRDLVAFAGLAHDLGHPPFGHNGEAALDDQMLEFGGFEGNAQTLRILCRLEKKVQSPQRNTADGFGRLGLDLTCRSLAAILKYDRPIPRSRPKDSPLAKGYYICDSNVVAEVKANVAGNTLAASTPFKTVECQIMDIADDIAYSTYDLEDSLKGGFLTPVDIVLQLSGSNELLNKVLAEVRKEVTGATADDVIQVAAEIFGIGVVNPDLLNAPSVIENVLRVQQVARNLALDGYARTAFTAHLVGRFMEGVQLKINRSQPAFSSVSLDPDTLLRVEVLKHVNYWLNIRSPRLQVVQYRGYEVVSKIFRALTEDGGHELLPNDIQQLYKGCAGKLEDQMRVICDFIAGMTDRYAIEFYGRLFTGDQSIFKPF